MAHLAPELILEILEWLYYTPKGIVDYASLSSCCLLSKAWCSVAQHLLFRRVKIKDLPPSRLAVDIRVLDIEIPPELSSRSNLPLFARIITSCSSLYDLGLTTPKDLTCFDRRTLSLLSSARPPIKALRICGASRSAILFQILAVFPDIRHLVLLSGVFIRPPRESCTHSFYEVSIRKKNNNQVLEWLFAASNSLRILEVWYKHNDMYTVLDTSNIQQLVSFHALYYEHEESQFVRICPNLQEIVVETSLTLRFGPFPGTVESLGYGRLLSSDSVLEIFMKTADGLPKLRAVFCQIFPSWQLRAPKLKQFCQERGIELRLTDNPLIESNVVRYSVFNIFLQT